ncbi:glycosyltransferase family 4 protein [Salinibacter ruber]|uniref:Glycosyltransferase involved in cell wall biosynthesis n=1 Tax=Salinibacter ruber TaxID=146919 RepID=A0A9X2TJ37_9BACT|nr:glycosyltransferase family 4 protein [Salinibacter ruber]MCS3662049.1 glycosyltransferase involved in cell wall biosynthesis [Salinibacter ruber]MCS3711896.1 glycosyltransferase involved in cell wall biosynthesis [Salinibacter ruber]
MSPPNRIALVVHDLAHSGGVSTVARFLHDVIGQSDCFEADLFSLAHGSDDRASVRLRDPLTWTRGVQVQTETNDGVSYKHVGAVGAEIEYCRYQPRSVLTERLRSYDLVQIVAGTPAWAHVTRPLDVPVALQVATLAREERSWVFDGQWRPKALWRQAMVRLTDRLDHTALRHVGAAFVENQWMHDHLAAHMPPDNVIFAPPGVDTEQFVSGPPPSQGEHILSVGRFEDPRKNVTLLFEAYAALRDRTESVPPLVLAGRSAPTDAAWVRAEALGIRDAVTFRENVSMDELARLYRTAALYVVSSDEEGLGLTILEAMASGRPVVSTACGGPSTTVLDGETGRLVPVGDAEALAGAMADVIGDPERANVMGYRGRERAEEHFSMEATGQRFLNTYAQLLDMSGS